MLFKKLVLLQFFKNKSYQNLNLTFLFIQSFIIILLLFHVAVANSAIEKSHFSILDANKKGTFNIGLAVGSVFTIFDKDINKQVLKFDYSTFPKTMVGVWTKKYPSNLNRYEVDAIKVGVKVPYRKQLREISVELEIKGEKKCQTVPISLQAGWNFSHESIKWNKIGKLKEIVFVVSTISSKAVTSPIGGGEILETGNIGSVFDSDSGVNIISSTHGGELKGTLYFSLDFYKMTFLQKYFIFLKISLIFIMSFLAGLIINFSRKLFKLYKPRRQLKHKKENHKFPKLFSLTRLKRDFLYGVISVLIIGIAFVIYSVGTVSHLDKGFSCGFLIIGLMGAVIAELLKYVITNKHLTSFEVFQNVLLTGLLVASSSRLAVFQAPSSWTQILMLNNIIAALAFLFYHILNARSLACYKKHLNFVISASIIVTPYLFNWLMLLEDIAIIKVVINQISGGLLLSWPIIVKVISRLFIAFIFNAIVMNGFSLVIRGEILKSFKIHLFIFFVSLGVVIAPVIADLGSAETIGSLPALIRGIIAILTTMLSFAGLWGEVYLITGMALDGGKHTAPSWETVSDHVKTGMRKGMVYSGILLGLLYILNILLKPEILQTIASNLPILFGILAGALVFPLLKTIIETFDGSIPFSQRTRYNYRDAVLYARGAVAGFGFSYALVHKIIQENMSDRILFGLIVGLFASTGVSILRDIVYSYMGKGKIQSWRLYFIDGLLGAFVGSGLAFYIDKLQVPVVIEKFKLYTSAGFAPQNYITYPLVNKWGRIDLGSYTGGPKLLFTESLAGVINWAIAAWLFAINKVFMQAFFEKHIAPIKFFFSKEGFSLLIEHMIYVLRWGLWMSPIIFTFLRMMPDPTWYNQDGAIRTLFAVFHRLTMSPEAFRQWSLNIFVGIMAYNFFRVFIWMDHMGLRVATMVNLSFLGLDRLDEKIARFIGPAAAQRYIPEAVKRFATWAPLLIPFYLPRGEEWNYVWNTSESIQKANAGIGLVSLFQSLTLSGKVIIVILAVLVCMAISFGIRLLRERYRRRHIKSYSLSNRRYEVVVKENGSIYSEVLHKKRHEFPKEYDISRRSYDIIDPCGRILYLVDIDKKQDSKEKFWPVLGNYPADKFKLSDIWKEESSIKIVNTNNKIKTDISISLPTENSTVEIWNISVKNLATQQRNIKIVPYLEWLLNGWIHDRFHTQYARLFPAMEYITEANAILSWQRSTKAMGFLAVDIPPEGFLTSRFAFIGRAQSIWKPRALETLDFVDAQDTERLPTFDPIGSLMIDAKLKPKASKTVRLIIGYAGNTNYVGSKKRALKMIKKYLDLQENKLKVSSKKENPVLITHGDIPQGTAKPYYKFIDNGNKMLVHTPYTPRPFDHAMSNALGHSVMVTNRGLHTSCNGNSQQNRLTPDWADVVTKEIPSEAIYLYDPDDDEWYSPTYHPLNNPEVDTESEFGVDGTALFRMNHRSVSTELTVFVPPDDPLGVYLLRIKNNADFSRRIRIAPYFQMVLAFQPENTGSLQKKYDEKLNALFFYNPRNMFRKGWAFASVSESVDFVETNRGRFFGLNRGVDHPFMVENGKPDIKHMSDDTQIASFLTSVTIPAGEETTIAVILGQTRKKKDAIRLVNKYQDMEIVKSQLKNTRKWWLNLMETVKLKTNKSEFDYLQNWLKYQAIAERVFARRGFYQTSGAYGFRDQLQDTVNIMAVDPALARKQILLHTAHQFIEGDVCHWFFTLTDGRSAFSFRSHASDNPIWLVWGVSEYIKATSDYAILDEMVSYMWSEFPFADLPKNKIGWGHLYHRSTRSDTVYKHCLKSIELVLEKRKGKHGLPLIRTGDWNDGLDEIGSEGKGESVWLGFFAYYILKDMLHVIEKKEGKERKKYYQKKLEQLKTALENTWREDRYLRAFHDDGTEIGIKDSGIWEIDALTVAWAIIADINFERGVTAFHTALDILEKRHLVLLGWPALREDIEPYLGRSSKYPEGVRENGMYCHGAQWLIKAARVLVDKFEKKGESDKANEYRKIAYRLWRKITPASHTTPKEIEIYGGQPNKQPADILTNFKPGRMIWNGYTGAAGWLFRQSFEGVLGTELKNNELILPDDIDKPRGKLKIEYISRDLTDSPLKSIPEQQEPSS